MIEGIEFGMILVVRPILVFGSFGLGGLPSMKYEVKQHKNTQDFLKFETLSDILI